MILFKMILNKKIILYFKIITLTINNNKIIFNKKINKIINNSITIN